MITIYEAIIRPHLDYGDVIFDEAFNNSFHQRLEPIQYNAAMAIIGDIRGTSEEKLIRNLVLSPTIQKMVSKIFCLLQDNKKRINNLSLSSNSQVINFVFYS